MAYAQQDQQTGPDGRLDLAVNADGGGRDSLDDDFHLDLQLFQRSGQLVRAAGASPLAIDAFQPCDDIADTHALAKGSDALRVPVATLGILDLADYITLCLDIDLLRTYDIASPE